MNLCMYSHGRRVFQTVCIYCLALTSVDLSGLVGEADYSPICLQSPLVHLALALGFFFTKYVVQNLEYPLSLNSQPCPIWKPWGLERFFTLAVLGVPALLLRGLPLMVSYLMFSEGLQSGLRNLKIMLPRNLVWRIRTNFLSSHPLVAGLPCPFGRYWLAPFLWDKLGTVVPFW